MLCLDIPINRCGTDVFTAPSYFSVQIKKKLPQLSAKNKCFSPHLLIWSMRAYSTVKKWLCFFYRFI